METEIKLDKKDYKILRELDINFRQSFSSIGKKVGLSKNSVKLRFEKLKKLTLHNVIGINNELLGYKLIKIYYSFDSYDEKTEKEIIKQLKKYNNILWAARLYGQYDLGIGIYIKNLDDLITQVTKFDNFFSKKINEKEIEIIHKQIYIRNNFIHKEPIKRIWNIQKTNETIKLNKREIKILSTIRNTPRIPITTISQKTKLSVKTISHILKRLEKSGIITGYFMTPNPIPFGFSKYKLMIQTQKLNDDKEFENYLTTIKNNVYINKMLGLWDYEIDGFYRNINSLQEQIEKLKQKFPHNIKKISIISIGKRIATNQCNFFD